MFFLPPVNEIALQKLVRHKYGVAFSGSAAVAPPGGPTGGQGKGQFVLPQGYVPGNLEEDARVHKALTETNKVSVAKAAIQSREYLAAVKPGGLFLVMELMHFAHEVLGIVYIPGDGMITNISKR